MNDLDLARRVISACDADIAALFEKRMEAVRRVAAYKKERGLPVYDPAREGELLQKNSALVEDPELRAYYITFQRNTMAVSRAYQNDLIGGAADPGSSIRVSLGERSYDILTDPDILNRAGELLDLDRRVLIVTDSGVPSGYAEAVARASRRPVLVTLPEGEGSKSFDCYVRLLDAMLDAGFTRHDCVAAVGGGVCGDLAGFAAATYMRGIDFYNIPTTVLSQVDSSIGGKTAVDFHGYKNTVGAFWQPKRVLADPEALSTLPPRQIANGLAEAVKMAATSDAELFRLFEEDDPLTRLPEIIRRSLCIKKAVVEADERESGLRRILNFGHTLGHAIESTEAPNLLHGECVALGMLPMMDEEARGRMRAVLEKLGLPTTYEGDPARIAEALTHDKKSAADGIDAVYVDRIGSCRVEKTPVSVLMERYRAVFGGTR